MQDRDPVGKTFGFAEVLGGEQHCGSGLGERPDGLPHIQPCLWVEPSGRLVEEDDRRIPDQTHRDVEAATHAPRVGRRPAFAGVGESETVELLVGDPARMIEVAQLGDQHEVLAPGENLVDRCELAGEADRFAHVGALRGHVEPVDQGTPGVSLKQRGEDLDDRGFAGSVGAEQSHDAAPLDVEVDAAQHVEVTEGLHQPGDPEDRSCGHDTHHAGLTSRQGQPLFSRQLPTECRRRPERWTRRATPLEPQNGERSRMQAPTRLGELRLLSAGVVGQWVGVDGENEWSRSIAETVCSSPDGTFARSVGMEMSGKRPRSANAAARSLAGYSTMWASVDGVRVWRWGTEQCWVAGGGDFGGERGAVDAVPSEPAWGLTVVTPASEVPGAVDVRDEVWFYPALGGRSLPVPVGECEDAVPGESFFDGSGDSGRRAPRRCSDPDAFGELLGSLSCRGVHDVEKFLQRGSTIRGIRGVEVRGECCGDCDSLRQSEIDRWQGRRCIDDVSAARTGLGPHWQPGLLQRGDVSLDGAGAHLESFSNS